MRDFFGVCLAAAMCLLVAGCGSPNSGSTGTPAGKCEPPQAVKEMLAEPEGPMPALAGPSRFLGKIDSQKFAETEAVSPAPLLRWDFSKKKNVTYSYSQNVESSTMMGNSKEAMMQKITANGVLAVKSEGNGTANLVLNNLKATTIMNFPKGTGEKAPHEMSHESPPFVLQGMEEDGSAKWGESDMEMLLKMLFPLPKKALNVNESFESPGKFPINLMGSRIYATGSSKTTLSGYVKIDGATCARLEMETDISKLNVPPELTATCLAALKGRAVFYFDVNDRSFVSGEVALMMSMRSDMPVPKMDFKDSKAPPMAMPKSMRMVVDSDNLIVLKRIVQSDSTAGESKTK